MSGRTYAAREGGGGGLWSRARRPTAAARGAGGNGEVPPAVLPPSAASHVAVLSFMLLYYFFFIPIFLFPAGLGVWKTRVPWQCPWVETAPHTEGAAATWRGKGPDHPGSLLVTSLPPKKDGQLNASGHSNHLPSFWESTLSPINPASQADGL